jgi:hypothetical protein
VELLRIEKRDAPEAAVAEHRDQDFEIPQE